MTSCGRIDVRIVVAKDTMSAVVKLTTEIEESASHVIEYGMVSLSTANCGEQCSISYLGHVIAGCKVMACVRREGCPHGEVDKLDSQTMHRWTTSE